MAATSFLTRPQENIKIMSWNINSIRTKIEKSNVESLLCRYDIICLNEIKTNLPIFFPGYTAYVSVDKEHYNRGGTCVLIRNHLNSLVYDMDVSTGDQVWFKLKCVPGVLFGACYVPPSDSVYFSYAQLSNIQEKVKCNECNNGCFIIGDLNCRLGVSVRDLPAALGHHQYSYPDLPDPVTTPNDNAAAMLGICVDEQLVVVNNMKTGYAHFTSKKTFKRGGEWISELDTCIISVNLVKYVKHFDVIDGENLPSDHAPVVMSLQVPSPCLDSVMARAGDLGKHGAECTHLLTDRQSLVKPPLMSNNINQTLFMSNITEVDLEMQIRDDVNVTASNLSEVLYRCARDSSGRNYAGAVQAGHGSERWHTMIQNNDDAKLWSAINWRGELTDTPFNENTKPSDDTFKTYFEDIFNPPNTVYPDLNDLHSQITIPVLDEPITTIEVDTQIKRLRSNKASGPDGIPPVLFKWLPASWILFIATLFNSVFMSGLYPDSWINAKMFVIFKRGSKLLPSNYRPINVINSVAKLYDMVLCARLTQWFAPHREQAGSQAGRGCTEHLLTLRLLMDVARRKNFKLFITFVDFRRAYDCVPRIDLFTCLKQMGCGVVMLLALAGMYKYTNSIIGTALIATSVGVRQGSPTSCVLFIIYVNVMIQMIKQRCPLDGFLSWLHILVMMDDTVLLSTTREGMIRKIEILHDFCSSHGMVVNNDKTKFMVVNGNTEDKEMILCHDMRVSYCTSYIYLGSPFTDDGLASTAVKLHANKKMCHVLKFISFVNRNNDVPFYIKRKVFDACVTTSVLYGCESWLSCDLKPIEKLYKWCIKELLGVRITTNNDICMVELGLPSLKALVKEKQRKYFHKVWTERNDMVDDPLMHVLRLVLNYNDKVSRYINDMTLSDFNDVEEDKHRMRLNIRNSLSNRLTFYKQINPDLLVHDIYTRSTRVNEIERVSWTRLRLSAHSLAVETGRWNRRGRGRLPMEERLCPCGLVQTETHVIETCPLSSTLRLAYNVTTVHQLLVDRTDYDKVCFIVHKLLALF